MIFGYKGLNHLSTDLQPGGCSGQTGELYQRLKERI